MKINNVVVYFDKISGDVGESKNESKTKYLKQGRAFLTVRGKQENVRVSWMGVDPDLLGKGVTVIADIETSEYDGKTFTSLNIRKVSPAFSSVNQAIITGQVTGVKEFGKMMSVDVKVGSLDWKTKQIIYATQKVTVMDKTSAVAASIKANINNEVLLMGSLAASNGFTDYHITSAAVVNGAGEAASSAAPTTEAPADEPW